MTGKRESRRIRVESDGHTLRKRGFESGCIPGCGTKRNKPLTSICSKLHCSAKAISGICLYHVLEDEDITWDEVITCMDKIELED